MEAVAIGHVAAHAIAVWESKFEVWLAAAISAQLAVDPPPGVSRIAQDAMAWADSLTRDGQARREALALRALEAVP
jgi:hypothetical protein